MNLCRTFLGSAAILFLSSAGAAAADGGSCNKCSDLPRLQRELVEQEKLRQLYRAFVPGDPLKYYYANEGSRGLSERIQAQFDAWQETTGGGGGKGKGGSSAELMVAWWQKDCPIVLPVLDENNKVRYGEDGFPLTSEFKDEEYRKTRCKEIADFALAHERNHQRVCRAKQNDKKSKKSMKDYENGDWIAADEARAYLEGIRHLRKTIAKLARECGWEGSSNPLKKDGTKTVPTPEQIETLKNNVRKTTKALGKGKKRGKK